MEKIKYHIGSSSTFFNSLNNSVERILSFTCLLQKAKKMLWFKMFFYFLLHLCSYACLYFVPHTKPITLVLNYIFIGISGMLLAFNVSHDACHETFSTNKKINYWLYHLSFNMQGTSAYLWKIRHIGSHHIFPNIDGCDADIDNNPFIRLSPQHPLKKYQRFQHIYAILVYSIYTLHWFLIKDFIYLFKKRLANLENKKHHAQQWILFFFWKGIYTLLLLVLPILSGYSFYYVLPAFIIMHVINSWFFIHSLIATHLCMETQFPKADKDGYLPHDYYTHQLATSLDYSPTSKVFNWFLGGFNSHAAHHLYPKLPHTTYVCISRIIERKAKEFNISYHKLSLSEAIASHYKYLKMMGRRSALT